MRRRRSKLASDDVFTAARMSPLGEPAYSRTRIDERNRLSCDVMRSPTRLSIASVLPRLLLCCCALSVAIPSSVSAQPGCQEFCDEPDPPCYREPDDPDCNSECNCHSPTYPACDPECDPGGLGCDPDPSCTPNPCWDEILGDICTDPDPPCVVEGERPFRFEDDTDGTADGQIFALNNSEARGCGTLIVDRTAYYSIFDTELSESCSDQRDETGYLTVSNSCNSDGWATQRNAGDRFLVADSDNTPACGNDGDCGAGEVCRAANSHGRCCVPEEPVFMGTFLLVAGEPNRICINHWCPEWRAEFDAGTDYGFVVNGCNGIESIHFKVDATAIACEDERTLQACSFGCASGECLPDPCDAADCPAYCMDGVCSDANPCRGVSCEHGCHNGRCLQNRHARGPDADGDGFSELADCDDTNIEVHPDRLELCGNLVDDNCDGRIDEDGCMGTSGSDAGLDTDSGPGTDTGTGEDTGSREGGVTAGCGCRVSTGSLPHPILLLVGMGLFIRRRRKS